MRIVRTWSELLRTARIPHTHLRKLYARAVMHRATFLERGGEPPAFNVELLIALWKPLATELETERINAKRYLPENAASVCKFCHGSNFRRVATDGFYQFVKPCKHTEKE